MDTPLFLALDAVRAFLRLAVLALAILAGLIALVDWLVRTRRINPFNPIARFFRRAVDPLMEPVERRVVRAGGLPSSAPWWTLVAVVVGGILAIVAFDFLRNQLYAAWRAFQFGARGVIVLLIHWAFSILEIALIVRVISSWFRISPWSRWIRWSYTLTEPILRPLRGVIPTLGMIDITPIVAYFILVLLERLLIGAFF